MHTGPELLCSEVRDRIAGWLDGELGPSDAEIFGRHLASCEACASEVARVQAQQFVPAVAPDTSAPGFWDRLDAAVERERALTADGRLPEPPAASEFLRLSRRQIAALVALLLISLSLAGVQTLRVSAAHAEVAALEQALRHQQRADLAPGAALPVEPVTVAVHSPYRGSL